MNLADLADSVATDQDISKTAAKRLIEAVFKTIVSTVESGDDVSLPSFGKFAVQSRPARQGRNPKTGATITIAASRKLAFAAAKPVRDALNK